MSLTLPCVSMFHPLSLAAVAISVNHQKFIHIAAQSERKTAKYVNRDGPFRIWGYFPSSLRSFLPAFETIRAAAKNEFLISIWTWIPPLFQLLCVLRNCFLLFFYILKAVLSIVIHSLLFSFHFISLARFEVEL